MVFSLSLIPEGKWEFGCFPTAFSLCIKVNLKSNPVVCPPSVLKPVPIYKFLCIYFDGAGA